MIPLFSAIIAIALIYCCFTVAPAAILLRFKSNKLALSASVIISAGLYYDHIRNWESISYPLWILRGFDDLFPLPFFASILMTVWVAKVILTP
jgi:hypothetical protein